MQKIKSLITHCESQLARTGYQLLLRFDRPKTYGYETAPYCGHYYSGHTGKRTCSHYHEGIGYCEAQLGKLLFHKNSEEGSWKMYWIRKPKTKHI